MDAARTRDFIETLFGGSILPALERYIRIPCLSPAFDGDWESRGHMDEAVKLVADWVQAQEVPGLTLEVVKHEGRTPVILMEIPGEIDDTVLLYGHVDKQPEMEGWSEDLGPFTPVIRDGKLYGRGGADDGYAAFSAITAIKALKEQGVPLARMVVLVEACEESGSLDLPHYIESLAKRLGTPSLIVCLDSGCANYEQLWSTTSLRGIAMGTLRVDILREGVHSGDAGGVVPSSFRILRQLLARIEEESTGSILPPALHGEIPDGRIAQARSTARILGDETWDVFPWVEGSGPATKDPAELILARTWRPALAVTGVAGIPPLEQAGNVLRPYTALKLSLRLPPSVGPAAANAALKELLEKDPPQGAKVSYEPDQDAQGWDAPALAPWLEEATAKASLEFFGKEACYMGEGGSIPFMNMLGGRFPEAQFLITGVLGPGSNAHGPNEFLEIATTKKLTGCVAGILADHAKRG